LGGGIFLIMDIKLKTDIYVEVIWVKFSNSQTANINRHFKKSN
jgi:hypothetical protein